MSRRAASILVALATITTAAPIGRADDPSFTRREDVIYGRKYGTALTMDVFTPKKEANGAAVVVVVSGGFFSSHEAINPAFVRPLVDRGYTVFAVVHGSQPRYTAPEIVKDVNRAVRFIRHHAKDYGIDPDRIGVSGASAGGHLSLMLGTAGDEGDPDGEGPGRPRVEPRAGRRLLLPADRLPQLRRPGPGADPRQGPRQDLPPGLRLPGARPRDQPLGAVTDPARLREITRDISPIYPRLPRRRPDPHHPRRRRHARPAPAIPVDRRAAQGGRRRREARRQARRRPRLAHHAART